MGAGVALQLAIRHPEAVRRLVMISASFRHDGMQPEGLAMFPTITPEMFAGSPMEDAYKQLAPDPGRFPELVRKLATLDSTPFAWPEEEVRGITAPTLIMVGDSDVVTVEHAVELYRLRGGRRVRRPLRAARVAARGSCPGPRTSSRRGTGSSTGSTGWSR